MVDWSWVAPRRATYTWTVEAAGARPARGKLGSGSTVRRAPPEVTLSALAAAPGVVAPAPDGTGTVAHGSFLLGRAAQVTAVIQDSLGRTVQTLLSNQAMQPGQQAVDWYAGGTLD